LAQQISGSGVNINDVLSPQTADLLEHLPANKSTTVVADNAAGTAESHIHDIKHDVHAELDVGATSEHLAALAHQLHNAHNSGHTG
jgi:hypothetical protein